MGTIIRINQCWESERRRRSKDFWVGFPFQEPANDISPFSKKQPALFVFFSFLQALTKQGTSLLIGREVSLHVRWLADFIVCLFFRLKGRKTPSTSMPTSLSVVTSIKFKSIPRQYVFCQIVGLLCDEAKTTPLVNLPKSSLVNLQSNWQSLKNKAIAFCRSQSSFHFASCQILFGLDKWETIDNKAWLVDSFILLGCQFGTGLSWERENVLKRRHLIGSSSPSFAAPPKCLALVPFSLLYLKSSVLNCLNWDHSVENHVDQGIVKVFFFHFFRSSRQSSPSCCSLSSSWFFKISRVVLPMTVEEVCEFTWEGPFSLLLAASLTLLWLCLLSWVLVQRSPAVHCGAFQQGAEQWRFRCGGP